MRLDSKLYPGYSDRAMLVHPTGLMVPQAPRLQPVAASPNLAGPEEDVLTLLERTAPPPRPWWQYSLEGVAAGAAAGVVQLIPLGVFGPIVVLTGLGGAVGETCGRPNLGTGVGLLAGLALEAAFIYVGNSTSDALVGIGLVAAATAGAGAVAWPMLGPRLEKARWIKEHLDEAVEVSRLRGGLQPEGSSLEEKGEWLTVGSVKVRRKKPPESRH